jgi:hypothetical protein
MGRVLVSRWFQLLDLVLVLVSGAIWYLWPQAGWWPLLIVLVPWIVRLLAGRFPFKRTVFDLPLAIFLVTAGVGVWAAYQREAAWAKFWIILGAVFLFYALANQSKDNLWPIAGFLGLSGAMLAVYFALTNDWQAQAHDLKILHGLTRQWMSLRPALRLPALPPNIAGGILALLLPFPLALGLRAWASQKWVSVLASIGIFGIILVGLVLTSSRGAWLASAAALGIWLAWGVSGLIASRLRQPRNKFFFLILISTGTLLLLVILANPGGIGGLVNWLPGISNFGSRSSLARSALSLVVDFPITGGGLRSFPGLYSQYIRITPFFLFAYSHNFYLDVALEQGVFGWLAMVTVLLGTAWLLVGHLRAERDRVDFHWLGWAVLAGLITVCLHGLIDDALYGGKGTPLLFLLAGIAFSLSRPGPVNEPGVALETGNGRSEPGGWRDRRWKLAGVAIFGVALVALLGWRPAVLAQWYANLGAVQMARVELADWPMRKWNESSDTSALNQVTNLFDRALSFNPNNKTAHHRLGLIALQARDYTTAEAHLRRAYLSDPGNFGLIKALGYSCVWSGQIVDGVNFLEKIPEAEHELKIYVNWWKQLGRADLSDKAQSSLDLLHDLRTSQ